MPRRWMPSEDIAVRLADALDAEDGGRRLLELARRLGRTEAAVRRSAWGLRAARQEPVRPRPERETPRIPGLIRNLSLVLATFFSGLLVPCV